MIMEVKNTSDALTFLYGLSLNQANLRFRGQANSDWPVQPSIYRFEGFQRYQAVLFERLLLDTRPKQPTPPLIHTVYELEWLMVAQHYAIPTRLLDWSRDILVALYFACEDKDNIDRDGALFICDQSNYPLFTAYNECAMECQEFSFISTNIVNPRMRLQSGSFMMWGHSPLDEESRESYDLLAYHKAQNRSCHIEKIYIPASRKSRILRQLDRVYSINHDSIYLTNGYLERKFLKRFGDLKEILRRSTLYLTDADRLSHEEESSAKLEARFGARNMFRGCTNIRKIHDQMTS